MRHKCSMRSGPWQYRFLWLPFVATALMLIPVLVFVVGMLGKERPVCTCLPGYTGNALSHCNRGECQSDGECSESRACINYSCVDPCIGQVSIWSKSSHKFNLLQKLLNWFLLCFQCGSNAICEARRHLAVCRCPQGYSGDALVSCRQSRSYPVAKYNKKK